LLASQHFKVVGCSLIFLCRRLDQPRGAWPSRPLTASLLSSRYNHLDRLAEERRIEVLS